MNRENGTSHQLLLGLLALQTGLVDQAALVAAFHAWTRDKARPLADYLVTLGHLDAAHRPLLEGLAEAHLARHGGDADSSLAAVPTGRPARESLARLGDAEIEFTLARLGSALQRPDGDTEFDLTATYTVGTASSDGQRFRILRPHARGGLGAVFVALDTELHREVALKQILESHADDPVSRQRFVVEAEVTGGLEHPGIVPVYGLGTHADGRPFYAMRFIRGESLKEAINGFHSNQALKKVMGRRSLELHKLLRRFTDVCNAIDYAHSRGVLHRDIKPANVIVGRHGETLVVDWGLAKATGKSDPTAGERTLLPTSSGGSEKTLPGSALGTPAYMSPEQAEGRLDRLGPRSDVYSLGATLYCLLTGNPPFAGDPVDVVPRVQRGDFRSPSAVDLRIDRALEAICLKAMALNPAERYDSCRALAEDVERWMADEPAAAWREPFSRRARRWARRNRTAVAAAAVALVVSVVGLSAVAAVQAQSNSQLREAGAATGRALEDVKAANKKTEEALTLSEDSRRQAQAVSAFLVESFRSPDPTQDGRQIKVVELLDRAAAKLDSEYAGDPKIKAELLSSLGRTYHGLGLYPEAIAVSEKSWSIRKAILGPEHADTIRSMADLGGELGAAYKTAEAIPLLEQALRFQQARLGANHADTIESMTSLASAYAYAGRRGEGIALLKEAVALQEGKLGSDHPITLELVSRLSYMYGLSRSPEWLPRLREILKLQEAKLGPGRPQTIETMIRLADTEGLRGHTSEWVKLLEEAVKRGKSFLGADHPDTEWAITRLIDAYGAAGRVNDSIGVGEEALKLCRVKPGSDNPHTLHTMHVLARAYQRAKRIDRCIALSEEVYERSLARLGHDHPDTYWCRQYLGEIYLGVGSFAKAEPLLRQTLSTREKDLPNDWLTFLIRSRVGGSLLGQKKFAEAEPFILRGYEGLKARTGKVRGQNPFALVESSRRVVKLYEAWGRPDQAAVWRRKLGLAELPEAIFAPP
jgi:tetratricopeptide (TPR) repeat protein/tRNA A-37 threonylcarbamoyl transferase component Bud32